MILRLFFFYKCVKLTFQRYDIFLQCKQVHELMIFQDSFEFQVSISKINDNVLVEQNKFYYLQLKILDFFNIQSFVNLKS